MLISKKKVKYSVIIPFYNQSKFVKQTIESVLDGIGPSDEIIAIDDCSPDNGETLQALMTFDDNERVNVYQNEINQGHVATLNRAAELSSGEYLIVLGGDDLLGKNFSRWLTPHFESGADIVLSPVKFFYNSDEVNLDEFIECKTLTLTLFWALFGWGKCMSRRYSIIGCAIRKSSFFKLGKFSEDMVIEDHDLFISAAKQKMKIMLVSGSFSYYRQVAGSISSNMQRMIKEDYRVIRKHTCLPISYAAMLKRLLTFSIVYIKRKL